MPSVSKLLVGGSLLTCLLIAGFIFSIRSCLSKYDQRGCIAPALYFGQGDSAILFSLVKFSETTSYNQQAGFTSKTYSCSYFIQVNRAISGEKISQKKIRGDERIKNFPEKILGASGHTAWLFLDEIMAFDGFTLEKTASLEMIEQKNPFLKGLFPTDYSYYHFDDSSKNIHFTAKDGSLWLLDTRTCKVIADEIKITTEVDYKIRLAREQLQNFNRLNISFNDMAINQDTANGQWFGMYSTTEMLKLNEKNPASKTYNENQRRQLVSTGYTADLKNGYSIDKVNSQVITPGIFFLQGGLLVDKHTGNILQLSDTGSYLVVYKSQVGNDAFIILAALSRKGELLWKINTNLQKWIDWSYHGNQLFIFGNNQKALNSSFCSLVLSVNLLSGKTTAYNYFIDKVIIPSVE